MGIGLYFGVSALVGTSNSTACPGESTGEFVGAWASGQLANKVVGRLLLTLLHT